MAFNKFESYGHTLGILDSEVGLVRKTRTGKKANATDKDGRKVILAGTLFTDPDDATDIGVVFEDYDMTDYDEFPISVVFQGRLREDAVSAEAKAKKSDFAAKGLYLV